MARRSWSGLRRDRLARFILVRWNMPVTGAKGARDGGGGVRGTRKLFRSCVFFPSEARRWGRYVPAMVLSALRRIRAVCYFCLHVILIYSSLLYSTI